jgi:hypothetical protein
MNGTMASRTKWTVVLRCYICKGEFTLRHLELERAFTVPLVTPCPHCFKNLHDPDREPPRHLHQIDDLREEDLDSIYRKSREGLMWHFCDSCSRWPKSDFLQIEMQPQRVELCGECSARQIRIKTH